MSTVITAQAIDAAAERARSAIQALAGHGPQNHITADVAACVRVDAMTDDTLLAILTSVADVAASLVAAQHGGPSTPIDELRATYPQHTAQVARAAIDIASDVQYALERANGLLRGPGSRLGVVPPARATLTDGMDWACTDLDGVERLAHLRALQTAAFKVHDALVL
jgi:hypothetical protein